MSLHEIQTTSSSKVKLSRLYNIDQRKLASKIFAISTFVQIVLLAARFRNSDVTFALMFIALNYVFFFCQSDSVL